MTAALEFQSSDEMRRRYSEASARLWGPRPKPIRFIPPPPVCLPTAPVKTKVRIPKRDEVRVLSEIKRIQLIVCDYYQVEWKELISARRDGKVIRPRHVAFYLCKKLTLKSLPEIGRRFGGRDHTTALSAIRKITRLLDSDDVLANDIKTLIERVLA